MKKVLLSLSMLAAVMSANAQSVGTGAYDDFNSQAEYGLATGGIYWFSDAVWTQFYPNFGAMTTATPPTPVRRDGAQMVFTVNKAADYTLTGTHKDDDAKYSPLGVSFGDTKGDGTGTPYTIDISKKKSISVDLKAYKDVTIRVQLKDINDKTIEATSTATPASDVSWAFAVKTTSKTFTQDLSNGIGLNWNAPCAPCEVTGFDYTQVAKILFFVDPGFAGTTQQAGSENPGDYGAGFQPSTFNGLVTFDNLKIGTTNYVGLGTTSAAANIASTKVFPNPATEAGFTAEVTVKSAASATIILTDMMGKQIATKAVDANGQANFATSGLAAGMYTVTYVLDGTPAKTELVVVK